MKKTKKQIIEIIIDVIAVILCVLLLIVAINVIASSGKGYTAYFGKLYLPVESNSMWSSDEANRKPTTDTMLGSFKKGDMLVVDELDDEEKQNLKVDDLITFKMVVGEGKDRVEILNTHRIVGIVRSLDGEKILTCLTRGDAAAVDSEPERSPIDFVVGKVEKIKVDGGGFGLWISTPSGFFVAIVLPSLLVVAYFVAMLIITFVQRNKAKSAIDKEEMRKQLEAEIREQLATKSSPENVDTEAETPKQQD
ncbi:MAG: S26 family signal peptidase [Clostridia bacterium]